MRCKYESFGCYYVSIHSPPPSGSSAIRGGKNVYCEKVDLESRRLFSITCGVFSRTYVYPMAQPLLLFILFFFLTPCPPCLFHLVFSSNTQFLHWFLLPLILSSSDTSTLSFHGYPHQPVWQSCAQCHVAATVFAQRASVSARRAGLAPHATREHAILAVKSTASATTGPASVSLAGRESTATLVSCVCVCACGSV